MNNLFKRTVLGMTVILFANPLFTMPPNRAELALLKTLQAPNRIQKKVDQLLACVIDRMDTNRSSLQILRNAGFKILSADDSIVCEHPELPNYIIKLPFRGHAQSRGCNFHRIVFAKEMRDLIDQANLNVKVPMKYACFADLKNLSDEGVVVIAEKLDLSNPQPLTQRQYDDMRTIIETLGFLGCHRQNVFGLGDCVAIIDTETFVDPNGNKIVPDYRKRSAKGTLQYSFGGDLQRNTPAQKQQRSTWTPPTWRTPAKPSLKQRISSWFSRNEDLICYGLGCSIGVAIILTLESIHNAVRVPIR